MSIKLYSPQLVYYSAVGIVGLGSATMSKVGLQNNSEFRFSSNTLSQRSSKQLADLFGKGISVGPSALTTISSNNSNGDATVTSISGSSQVAAGILDFARNAVANQVSRINAEAQIGRSTRVSSAVASTDKLASKAELDAKAAVEASTLGEFWEIGTEALGAIVETQVGVLSEIISGGGNQAQSAALEAEFQALSDEYNRVYETMFGATGPATYWTTPSGYDIGFTTGLSYSTTDISSQILAVTGGTGTPVSLVDTVSSGLDAVSGGGGGSTVLEVGGAGTESLTATGVSDSFVVGQDASLRNINSTTSVVDLYAQTDYNLSLNGVNGFQSTGTDPITGLQIVSDTTDVAYVSGINLSTGDRFRIESGGTPPGGLTMGTDYYAIRVDSDRFKFATTYANAIAGTAVDITSSSISINISPFALSNFNETTDEISTAVASNVTTGTRVQLTSVSGFSIPGGLSTGVDYYAINVDSDTIKLAASAGDALLGVAVDFTGIGGINTRLSVFATGGGISLPTDTINKVNHGFLDNTRVTVSSSISLPGGLSALTPYYIRKIDDNSFQLSLTSGGAAIDITSAGSGQLTVASTVFDSITDIISLDYNGYTTGQAIRFNGGASTLPTGLSKNVDYYVITTGDANTFKVASSYANALTSTAIDFSGFANGTITVQPNLEIFTDTNSINLTGHGLTTGTRINVSSSGTLPGGLSASTDYYAIVVDTNTIKLAASPDTARGNMEINLTSLGTGNLTITSYADNNFNAATDEITFVNNNLVTGQRLQISGAGSTPTGLTKGIDYYAISTANPNTFKVATSLANAIAGTAVDFSGSASGALQLDYYSDVTIASDAIRVESHGLTTGTAVRVQTAGTAPGGLSEGVDYYAIVVDSDTIELATSALNAAGGTQIDITSVGTGPFRILPSSSVIAEESLGASELALQTGVANSTTRVSTTSTGAQGASVNSVVSISADGRYIVFTSDATNLVAGDTNATSDAFVKDTVTGITTRVSTDSSGNQGTSTSYAAGISSDGRYVTFSSVATNLVSDDTNGFRDVFIKDMATGITTRVSTDSAGNQGQGFAGNSDAVGVSADGRYVLFNSDATNLVAGDTNNFLDAFVKDLVTGVTTRVSTDSAGAQGNLTSRATAISADGQTVVFESIATNLVVGDTNGRKDVFVKYLPTNATTRVSTDSSNSQGNDGSYGGSVSENGRYIVFSSLATNLVAGDTNNDFDVFVKDINTGVTTRVSTDSLGAQGNGGSADVESSISADGRYVIFRSGSSNLVAGDTNGYFDIFLKDTLTGATTRVSTDSAGAEGNDQTLHAAISANGRFVAFESISTNLVTGDTNFSSDTFLKDITGATPFNSATNEITKTAHGLVTGQLVRFTGSGTTPTGLSKDTDYYAISTDANTFQVATSYANALATTAIDFSGSATGNVVAEGLKVDTVNNRLTSAAHGFTTGDQIRVTSTDNLPGGLSRNTDYYAIVDNANHIRFATSSVNALAGTAIDLTSEGTGTLSVFSVSSAPTVGETGLDASELALITASPNAIMRASTTTAGAQLSTISFSVEGVVSSDGRYVAFSSDSANFTGDTNGAYDGFIKDTVTGITTRVTTDSLGNQANGNSSITSITDDGRYILFTSEASNLVAGDTNGVKDAFIKDTITGTTTRVSTDSSGVQANNITEAVGMSADGRYVLLHSSATNLVAGDTNLSYDAFVKDTVTGVTTRVSTDSAGTQGSTNSFARGGISADGRFVIFDSFSSNLVAGDTNGQTDVFRKDLLTGTTTRISTDSTNTEATATSHARAVSADGRYVLFNSYASNLVAGDSNGSGDAFVKDTLTGTTTRVSTSSSGVEQNGTPYGTTASSISADGRYVTFLSDASNLVAGDTNNFSDVFRKDTLTGTTTRITTDSSGAQVSGYSGSSSTSADGRFVVFLSNADNLVPGDTNSFRDIFLKDVTGATPFDSTTNEITKTAHGLVTGQLVRFTGLGTPPTGLSKDTDYYAISTGANTFQVATSYANALATTAIDFSGSATGNLLAEGKKVDTTNNRLTFESHGFTTGDRIRVTSTGSLPGGLAPSTDYYAIVDNANHIRFATSSVNALAGTAIDLTSAGSGTLSITEVSGGGTTSPFDPATDEITLTANGFTTGQTIRFTGTGTAPTGLSKDTDYYAIATGNPNTFKVAATYAAALTSTALNFTSASTGELDVTTSSSAAFFNATLNSIRVVGSSVATGQRLQFSGSGATAPTGLSLGVDYYAIAVDADNFKVATSLANALSATEIDFSGSASGNISVTTLGSSDFDPTADTITIAGNSLSTGQRVNVSSSGGAFGYLPSGLSAGDYYIIKGVGDTIKLATSLDNANNGVAVNFTGAGASNIRLEAYSETTGVSSGTQGTFDLSSYFGKLSTQASIDNLANSLDVIRTQGRVANSRTKSIAAYSRKA